MESNQNLDRFLETLKKINDAEQKITSTPQYKIIDDFVKRLLLKEERQATIFIDAGTRKFSVEDIKGFVDMYCFESVFSTADDTTKRERLFIIEYIVVGGPLSEEAFLYIDQLAFGSHSDQQEGALNMLLSCALKGFRKEKTFKLFDQNITSFKRAISHKSVQFLTNHFKDDQLAIKIINKAHKVSPQVPEASHNSGENNNSKIDDLSQNLKSEPKIENYDPIDGAKPSFWNKIKGWF